MIQSTEIQSDMQCRPDLRTAAEHLLTVVGEGMIENLIDVDPLLEPDLILAMNGVLAALGKAQRPASLFEFCASLGDSRIEEPL